MEIKFHSTVIMTEEFEQMKSFYQNILQQKIEEAKAKVKKIVDELITREKAKFEEEVNKNKAQIEAEVNRIKESLVKQKSEIDSKADISYLEKLISE